MAIAKLGLALAAILVIAGLAGAVATVAPAAADGTGSRILDSPSRDVIHRNEPALRSIVPGGNRTTTRSLSGLVGDLRATAGRAAASGLGPARPSGTLASSEEPPAGTEWVGTGQSRRSRT